MRSAASGSGFCRSLPMSADTHLSHEEDRVNVKRKGLRIAVAVAVGFSWLVYSGAIIPFLGPLFAAQFLISSWGRNKNCSQRHAKVEPSVNVMRRGVTEPEV